MELVTNLWKWYLQRGISIQPQHIGGLNNQIAGFGSRRPYLKSNWMIHPIVFQQLQHRLGKNDLSDMHTSRSYAISTIQLFSSGVSQLHHTPTVLTKSVELNRFIQMLKYQSPSVRLHRPTIDLKPAFNYISSLDGPSI
ncbi:hypothetical protein RMATCC62417_04356 [Rhizopus microsporus]|nr:hypothetical protein RMATCC62417_04356 [Rhizopus microsporus]